MWVVFTLFLTSWLLLMKRLLHFVWLLDLRYSAVVLLLVKMENNCSLSSFNAARWQEAGFYLFFSLKWHSWASRRKSFILTRNFASLHGNSYFMEDQWPPGLGVQNYQRRRWLGNGEGVPENSGRSTPVSPETQFDFHVYGRQSYANRALWAVWGSLVSLVP